MMNINCFAPKIQRIVSMGTVLLSRNTGVFQGKNRFGYSVCLKVYIWLQVWACLTRMKTQAGCRLSSLKTQLNAVRRRNACKVLGIQSTKGVSRCVLGLWGSTLFCYIDVMNSLGEKLPFEDVVGFLEFNGFTKEEQALFARHRKTESEYYIGERYWYF